MTKTELFAYLKDKGQSQDSLAKSLGLSQPTISLWPECIPSIHQLTIEKVTRGALVADAGVWEKVPRQGRRAVKQRA